MSKIEEKALKILSILTEHNHEAYIVGGYVRDKILGRKSNDIDICTSATPKEIMELFPNTSSHNYGSINIIYKNKTGKRIIVIIITITSYTDKRSNQIGWKFRIT